MSIHLQHCSNFSRLIYFVVPDIPHILSERFNMFD